MRDKDFNFLVLLILTNVVAVVLSINWHWSETRNLQRRVGQLEQQVNR